jgi:hypothetical protein
VAKCFRTRPRACCSVRQCDGQAYARDYGGIDVMAAPVFLVMVMQVTSGLVFDYKGRVLLCGFADQLYGLGPLTGCLQVVLAVPDFVTRTPGCSSMCPAHASHHPVLNGGVSLE